MAEAKRKSGDYGDWVRDLRPELDGDLDERTAGGYTGQNMPNADVFLAAMKVAGIKVDERLFGASIRTEMDQLGQEVARLQAGLEDLVSVLPAIERRLTELTKRR